MTPLDPPARLALARARVDHLARRQVIAGEQHGARSTAYKTNAKKLIAARRELDQAIAENLE